MCSYLQLQPEGISGSQMHLITQGELATENSDSYVVITNKSFNTLTMCENTEERLMSGSVPVKRPPVNMKNAVGAKKREMLLTLSTPVEMKTRVEWRVQTHRRGDELQLNVTAAISRTERLHQGERHVRCCSS